jgi:exodeoxyribonuclease VII large subunit
MALSIKQLNEFIKTKLPNNMLTVKGEIRQPKISGGHMYTMMKDDTGMISCVVWKSKINDDIKTLKDGDMIEANGTLDFYVPRGEIKFIIQKIKKEKTVGDMFAEFEKMKAEFKKLGYFDKKLKIPQVIKKIAILTSMNGAAIHDFMHTLENNKSMIECDKIDMVVQGSDCPRNIVEYLNNNDMKKYDMVVITRGGGSMEDLWGFNNKNLIETIYDRNYVVMSAIGHMVDTTLLDFASDITCATPSLAAQYIVDHNKNYIDTLNNIKNHLHMSLIGDINKKLSLLDRYDNIKNDFNEKLINKMKNYKQTIMYEIKNRLVQLDRIEDRYKENIALYSDNINLNGDTFRDVVTMNKPFTIVWNGIVVNVSGYNVI